MSSFVIDPATLTDPRLCPACGARLSAARCAGCGADLAGPLAARVWQLSLRAAAALEERAVAVAELRAETERAAAKVPAVSVPAVSVPAVSVPAVSVPGVPVPGVPVPPAVRRRARVGVQDLLLGLGALLVAVAAIVFLVVAWDRFSLGGRAAVVGGLTLAALAASAVLRRSLPATGEAIGAIGTALVLADAWAVRATGLFGADRVAVDTYTAASLGCCAVLLAGWGVVGRVRTGTIAATVLAPLACAVAGVAAGGALAVTLGLLAAALIGTARAWTPPARQVERVLLRSAAIAGLPLAAVASSTAGNHAGQAAGLLLTAAVAAAQSPAERGARDLRLRRGFSAFAGLAAACVAVPATASAVDGLHLREAWTATLLPTAAGLVALAVAVAVPVLARLRVRAFAVLAGAWTGVAVLAAPLLLDAVLLPVMAAAASLPPWRFGASDPLRIALVRLARPDQVPPAVGLVAVAVLLAAAAEVLRGRPVRGASARGTRFGRGARTGALSTGSAALALAPLAPDLPIAAVLGLLALVGVGCAVAAGRLLVGLPVGQPVGQPRRAALSVAATTGTLAVLVSWTVPVTSGPLTLAGAAALLAARLVTPRPQREALLPVAVTAAAVAAGAFAGAAGLPVPDTFTVAGLVAAALAAGLATVRRGFEPVERVAGVAAAALVVAVALLVTIELPVAAGGGHGRVALLLGVAALAAAGCAAGRELGRTAQALAAGAVVPLLAGCGSQVFPDRAGLPAAAVVAGAATALAVAVLRAGVAADHRRLPAEAGAGLAGLAAIALTPDQGRAWVVVMLLGVAVAAIATPADRRPLGWLSGALLTVSSGLRLDLADVGTVEAYTLPPALALLAVAALRARSQGARSALRPFVTGAGLALGPSIVASAGGGDLRPWLLLGTGAVLVASGWLAGPRGGVLGRVAPALLVAGAAAAAGGGLVRSVLRPGAEQVARAGLLDVERWAVPGALVAAAALLGLARYAPRLLASGRGSAGTASVGTASVGTASVGTASVGTASVGTAGVFAAGVFAVAALPTLLVVARGGPYPGPRAVAVLAAAAALALGSVSGPALRREPLIFGRQATAAGVGFAVAAALAGWSRLEWPVEAWSLPLAGLLAALGAVALRDRPALRSWPALSAALVVGLGPSLLLVLAPGGRGEEPGRVAALVVLGGGVLLAGALLRLQAPVLAAGLALAVLAVDQLGARVVHLVATAVPQWASLSAVGAVLLVVGATYERRVRELRAVRRTLAELR